MQNQNIQKLLQNIEPFRNDIINHELYLNIKDIEDLKVFMEFHVFAVWDFMSLLKSLQKNLTCTTIPWMPKSTGEIRYFINEVVIGEESDLDINNVRKSHFEMYLEAMEQSEANSDSIQALIENLHSFGRLDLGLNAAKAPKFVQDFVKYTFKVIKNKSLHLQAGIFTFGREDLIPDMFLSIIKDMPSHISSKVTKFKYYLERHIEIDGDHHKHLAYQMTQELCGTNDDNWKELETEVIKSLVKRKQLWDGILEVIKIRNESKS
ncbi:MAG: DUF3050 domain-containing protein [Leadbetterella sp.]|nr:DUF3050 domain-containing protein [Leadbetterella sp.]